MFVLVLNSQFSVKWFFMKSKLGFDLFWILLEWKYLTLFDVYLRVSVIRNVLHIFSCYSLCDGCIVIYFVTHIILWNSALKLEYLDLYLIHWPLKFTTGVIMAPKVEQIQPLDIPKTWTAMEECVQLGLTKAIGVSNFSSKKILDLLQIANIVPAVNQVGLRIHKHMHRCMAITTHACRGMHKDLHA